MKHYRFGIFVLLFMTYGTVAFAQLPNTIVVGVVYNIFHEEYPSDQQFFEQVDKDITTMKSSNITHVMIFPMGQWNAETKQLIWKRTDYLVKKIEEAQLKFVPLMLKEEQTSHYFPIWKFKEIKGLWDEHNLNNKNKNNRDNLDFADPRIYPLVEEYFKAVIERYGKSPALSFYNIWNEPHYSSEAPHVVNRFRNWLREKYRTLAELSRSWGEVYSDWEQVTPFLTENWKSSMPQIDWTIFKNELNGILLGELSQTLRKYDSTHPINANPVGTTWANFSSFGSYNIDNWVLSKYNDINGISYYPDGWEREHNLEPCPFWLHNLTFNIIRSASGDKNYILTELFTNTQNGFALNGYLTKDFVNQLIWTALANDCKGMIFWKWEPFMRGRQSLGRGLTTVGGKLAPRGEAVKEFGSVINKYGEIIFGAHPKKAQAAILVDIVGLIKTLEQSNEPSTNKFMYESNAGLFKALYEENISVDMLRMDLSLNLETLKAYKIIYLPFQVVMRRDIAELLKEYAKQGGCIVADARTATIDELDFAYRISPGAGLDSLFGAERNDWTAAKKYYDITMGERTPYASFRFRGKYFRENLKLKAGVEILGRFTESNEPAIIKNHFGKGTAILSAVPLGASYYDKPENAVNKLLIKFAFEAGIQTEASFISDDHTFVDIKVHSLKDTFLVYSINTNNVEKRGTIKINVGNLRVRNVTELISDEKKVFEQKGETILLSINIKPNRMNLFLIN